MSLDKFLFRIPARKIDRNGQVIYSKVDDNFVDLTEDNCQGFIAHYERSDKSRCVIWEIK